MVGKSFLFGDIGAVRIGEGGQLYWRMYRFIIIIIFFFFFFFFFFRADKNLKAVAGSASPRKKFHGMGTGSFGSVF